MSNMPSYRCLYNLNCSAINKRLLKVLTNSSSASNVSFMRYHLASSNDSQFCRRRLSDHKDRSYRLYESVVLPFSLSKCSSHRHFSISSTKCTVASDNSDTYFNAVSTSSDDGSVSSSVNVIDPIITDIDNQAVPLESGDQLFSSVGLGGWTPPGIVQTGMEYLHVSCGLPWWGCVVCGTILIRITVLPLVIRFQKNITKMNNAMPELQQLQLKMMHARQSGNLVDAARYTNQITELVITKNINPLKNMVIPLIQMPFFLSFFFGLRGMADNPVESLHHGGMSWFADLTVPDPYYILPVITCATLLVTVELGLDTGVSVNQVHVKAVKYIMRAMPFMMFPFFINFPGIILVYWLSTNAISLVQMKILRTPSVRTYLGFENPPVTLTPLITNINQTHATANPGFSEGFRESLTNLKISQELMERQALEKETRGRKEKEILDLQDKIKKLKSDLSNTK